MMVMLLLITFTWTSEWVMFFGDGGGGNREIGTLQMDYPESSIATSEKIVSLMVKMVRGVDVG